MRTFTTRLVMTLVAVAFAFSAALAQGVTTSSINGKITDTNGEPLIGANILAVHTPSGATYGNSTNENGIYRIPNMRVGGPYTITISYTGYEDLVRKNVYLRLGQAFNLSPELSETALTLDGVEVVAYRNDVFDGNRTGAETVIDEVQINKLPTVARSLGDFTRLTPQGTASEGGDGFELSFNGMNNRYNAIYIDGAVNNDVFGLAGSGTNGGQTGVSPISIDAIEEFQVSLAPFDVRVGGFAGAAISAITRSGTNNWEGSVYGFYRNQSLAGKTPTDNEDIERVQLNDFNAYTTGFRIGGPIKEDKLFFFVNAEIQRDVTPLPFIFDDYTGDSDQGDLDQLVSVLDGFGYDPGTYINNERFLNSNKITTKLDWNINNNNKLAFRVGWVNADNLEGVQSDVNSIAFLNSSERFLSNTISSSLELNTLIGSTMSNSFTLGYTSVRDDRDPNGEPFPYVLIEDGAGEITFGSEQFSTANLLNQDVFTLTNNFEVFAGKHTLTFGTHNEFYSVGNLFIPFNYGSYEYASLGHFLGDSIPQDYIRSFSLVDNVIGDESEAIAAFNAGQIGVYVQDEYQATDNLKLTVGVRLDVPIYGDTPVNEEFNETTIPMLEQVGGYDLRGARTGQFIQSQLQFSPRLGFNWDLTGDRRSQLRGGVGIFTSRSPLVWVGGAYNNYGLNRGTVFDATDTFIPDVTKQPPGDINPNNAEPSGDIDLFAEDFKLPQFLKANLAFDQKLPWGMIGNIDLMYNKTLQNVAYQNLNLRPAVGNLSGTPDDRPIYDRRDEIDPTYGRILFGYNTTEGYSYNLTAQLTKPFDNGFQGMIAYSYGDAFAVFDGTSSQNSSQWRGLHSVGGRNFDQPLARSDFSQGGRFIAGISYEINEGDNLKTTVSIFHESVSGRPYSYIYNDSGNLTSEDSRERELIYVPASANEIVLVDDGDLTAEQQWEALDAFIESDPYLSTIRGEYAERNQSRGPWQHVMDLRVLQDFSFIAGEKEHKFQLSFDIFNFTNLLNPNWGRRYFLGSFGNQEILDFEGFQEDVNGNETTVPTFTFNPGRLNDDGDLRLNIDDNGIQSSRWQMQIGLRYLFN
jgi:hypothetical protein